MKGTIKRSKSPKLLETRGQRLRRIVAEIDDAKYKGRRSSAKHGGKGGRNMK